MLATLHVKVLVDFGEAPRLLALSGKSRTHFSNDEAVVVGALAELTNVHWASPSEFVRGALCVHPASTPTQPIARPHI